MIKDWHKVDKTFTKSELWRPLLQKVSNESGVPLSTVHGRFHALLNAGRVIVKIKILPPPVESVTYFDCMNCKRNVREIDLRQSIHSGSIKDCCRWCKGEVDVSKIRTKTVKTKAIVVF